MHLQIQIHMQTQMQIQIQKSQYPTCDDNFDGMMDPSLSVASHASVVGEVAVPDSVDPQLRPIVHHLDKFQIWTNSANIAKFTTWKS